MSAVLYALVGLPCAGKTTYAKALEARTGAVRFTPDEWHTFLFGHDMDDAEHDARHDRVEALMRKMADTLLKNGVSVILDFGFWGRAERDALRVHAAGLGAGFELHYLDTPLETIYDRIEARNNSGRTDIFRITRKDMETWLEWWEPPMDTEDGLVRILPHNGEIR